MLNLNQFRAMYVVMKQGSFTAAANLLGISQPAVSMQVKNFQDAAGVRLYRLEGKRVIPTEAGRRLIELGDRIFEVVAQADTYLAEMKRARRDRVTIVSTRTIVTYVMPTVMRAFHRENAATSLRVDIGRNEWCYEQVIDGIADFGLLVDSPPHPMLEITELFTDRLVLFASMAHVGNREPLSGWGNRFPVYLREAGSRTRQLTDLAFAQMGFHPASVTELADVEAIKNAVRAGPSLAVLPSIAIRAEMDAGILRTERIGNDDVRMVFQLIRRGGESSPVIRQFLASFADFSGADSAVGAPINP